MLQELYISNFALIDDITVDFSKGLNIFTGATGVGKSLLMGALNFLLGSRVSSDIARDAKKEAMVVGVFALKDNVVREQLEAIVDDILDGEIVIQRSLSHSGRNRCRVNNRPITVPTLKEIGERLVDIHGQHEHESLINTANQLAILDTFGKVDGARKKFSDIYKKAVEKEIYLRSLQENRDIRRREIDLCRFEVAEIENAGIKPGELEQLEDERNVLVNAETICDVMTSGFENLYGIDNSVIERLKGIAGDLEKIAEFDNGFVTMVDGCNQSIYQLEEVAIGLRDGNEKFTTDPDRLAEIEERIDTIRKLKNKYGQSVADIIDHHKKAKQRLTLLIGEDDDFGASEGILKKLKKDVITTGRRLTSMRKKASARLSKLIKDELGELGIPDGRFEVNIACSGECDDADRFRLSDITRTGFDCIEFMFSSNPGEETQPLRKIASGGEISRVMLALKRQLASVDNTPVLVFDEIDANIGGRMGRVIGEKLKTVSLHHQIICITHLPQIASYADKHLKVNKIVSDGRTTTEINILEDDARLEEIAEMIRGEEKTDVTRKQASEMLKDAGKFNG